MRTHGINVIHGGSNALRYTPPFDISSEEVDLIVQVTRDSIVNGPRIDSAEKTGPSSEAA